MKFACPDCTQRFDVPEDWEGNKIQCTCCGQTVVVPSPSEIVPLPPRETPPPPQGNTPSAPPPQRPQSPPPRRSPSPVSGGAPLTASPRPRGTPIFAWAALLVGLLAVGAFAALMVHNEESPQQTWGRLTSLLSATPSATPPPAPTPPAVLAQQSAAPGPTARPMITPPGSSGLFTPPPATPLAVRRPEPTPVPTTPARFVTATPPLDPAMLPPVAIATPPPSASPMSPGNYFGQSVGLPGEPKPEPSPTPSSPAGGLFGDSGPRTQPTPSPSPAPPRPPDVPFPAAGSRVPMTVSSATQQDEPLSDRRIVLTGSGTLRLTAAGDPLPGSVVNLTSPDAWLLLEKIPASVATANFVSRLWVNGAPATPGVNVRVTQYGSGCAVIPHGPDFAAMQVFGGPALGGASLGLRPGVKYNAASLGAPGLTITSFRLKRGYTATIAQEENGTGISKNYVAQDADLEVRQLPTDLEGRVRFVRVFPWRWTSKKGVSGNIYQNLSVGWYYNWNIDAHSTPDLEYVPIRQSRYWPGLNQDWLARGSTHLLGYNEPDHKDQSNLNVGDALFSWPDLLATGLRLGSPAVSDGGLKWLYEFIEKADAAHLRVDFIAVHYYRAFNNPADARGAAAQFHAFLQGIHDRTHRPIWVTEWNNGANWTGHKPSYEQEKAAVAEMVKMLDDTPFVERYAIYNWVEDERNVQRKDGSLTPAGEVYRDDRAPLAYRQQP